MEWIPFQVAKTTERCTTQIMLVLLLNVILVEVVKSDVILQLTEVQLTLGTVKVALKSPVAVTATGYHDKLSMSKFGIAISRNYNEIK